MYTGIQVCTIQVYTYTGRQVFIVQYKYTGIQVCIYRYTGIYVCTVQYTDESSSLCIASSVINVK